MTVERRVGINMDLDYSKREIDNFMGELDKRMTHQDGMLSEIKIQTTRTNGRVNGHSLQFKVMWVIVCCAAAMIAGIGPFMYHVVLSQIQQDFKDSQESIQMADEKFIEQTVTQSVSDSLSSYNIKVNVIK